MYALTEGSDVLVHAFMVMYMYGRLCTYMYVDLCVCTMCHFVTLFDPSNFTHPDLWFIQTLTYLTQVVLSTTLHFGTIILLGICPNSFSLKIYITDVSSFTYSVIIF